MTRLLMSHREKIAKRVVDAVRAPRESKLRECERALAVKLVRWRYGDDVFDRVRALPEGWLPFVKTISIGYSLRMELPAASNRCVELDTAVPLPESARYEWKDLGPLHGEVHDLFADRVALDKDLNLLRQQTLAVLSAFTTVERLAADWPEGYAMLPAEQLAPPNGLPAPRIADLNARIAALKEAA